MRQSLAQILRDEAILACYTGLEMSCDDIHFVLSALLTSREVAYGDHGVCTD